MKRRLNVLIRIFYLLPPIILLFGCVTTPRAPMEMPVQNLSQIAQNEGIIVGSVLVMGPKTVFGTRPRCWLIAKHDSEKGDPYAKEYSLETVWEEEKIFVTKMPAGDYYFTAHRYQDSNEYIGQRFTVQPGKTVYIGRLVIRYPGRHFMGGPIEFRVFDAKELTLARVEKTYGSLVHNAVTDLMGKIIIPQTFQKVPYRPGKKKTLLAYSHTGALTIGKEAIEFRAKGKELHIPYSSVLHVRRGKLGMDTYNEWAIVSFQAEGSKKVAAFAVQTRTREMYRTLEKAYAEYKASEGK